MCWNFNKNNIFVKELEEFIKEVTYFYFFFFFNYVILVICHYFPEAVAKGFRTTNITESPRKNILEINLSLFTGFA
jgi:hypothetical protein